MADFGKLLLLAGIFSAILGCLLLFFDHYHLGKVFGDIHWTIGQHRVHFLFGTSIVISVIITLILHIIRWFFTR